MLRKAIFTLALASGGAAAWLSGGPEPVTADAGLGAAVPMEHVLVAAADIVPGTRIDPAALRWQPWPQGAVSESYITRGEQPDAVDAFTGMAARSPLMNGDPVHAGKLAPSDAGLLSAMLSPGMRAVAVRISADTTAGGFILPNDRVDVLHVQVLQGLDGQAVARSRTILRKVRVLAIDQTIDADTGSVVGKTATLELPPQDAEAIVAAEAAGAITLALRSVGDVHEPEPAVEDPGRAPAPRSVRVFRGVQAEIVELGG